MLMNTQEKQQQKIRSISKQLAKPWRDKYEICDVNMRDDDSTVRCCWNCGIFVHRNYCSENAPSTPSSSLERFLASFTLYSKGNADLESLKQPDFVKHTSTWTRKTSMQSCTVQTDA